MAMASDNISRVSYILGVYMKGIKIRMGRRNIDRNRREIICKCHL